MASGRRSRRPLTNKVEVSYFLSQEAEEELAAAIAFYNEQASTSVANAFLSEFTRAARLVAENPGLGKPTSRGRRRLPRTAFLTRLTRSSTARKMKVYASEPSRITVAALAIGARANEPRAVLIPFFDQYSKKDCHSRESGNPFFTAKHGFPLSRE